MPKQTREPYLWHYTTPEGLIGIVKDKMIWATEVFYLNDWEEFLGGLKLAQDYLQKLRDQASARQNGDQVELLESLRNRVNQIGPSQSLRIYVCSFSAVADDLSQWRAYCQRGGFAIGFPRKRLQALAKKNGFVLNKCVYNLAQQKQRVKKAVDNALQKGPSPIELLRAGPDSESLVYCALSGELVWELTRVCPMLKHDMFKSEGEWRLVSQPRSGGDVDYWRFRAQNGMVVPYKEFPLEDDVLWRKTRVTVGPTPHPAESKASVQKLLRCHTGFAHAVTNTSAPYRSW